MSDNEAPAATLGVPADGAVAGERILTSAEREKYLGAVRAAHREAFPSIEAAGAVATLLVSVVTVPGHPRVPAVSVQLAMSDRFMSDGCALTLDEVKEAVLRGVMVSVDGPRAPKGPLS